MSRDWMGVLSWAPHPGLQSQAFIFLASSDAAVAYRCLCNVGESSRGCHLPAVLLQDTLAQQGRPRPGSAT